MTDMTAAKGLGASADAAAATTARHAYEVASTLDPTKFYPKYGPLPAVTGVRDQTGAWDTPGRTRTLLLSDGGSVVETITDARPQNYFAYDLSRFQKLFGRLVTGARAQWHFDQEAGGTRIAWTYTFYPQPGAGLVVRAIIAMFWAPYMKRVLPTIAREAERPD